MTAACTDRWQGSDAARHVSFPAMLHPSGRQRHHRPRLSPGPDPLLTQALMASTMRCASSGRSQT
jgi:hypothetical protein